MIATRMLTNAVKPIKSHFPALWIEAGLRWRKGHYEPELFLVPWLCNKDQIAIDVGANQGVYTYYMAKFAKEVMAFEPNIDLEPVLKKVANGNVRFQFVALSNIQGESVMRIDPKDHGISTIERRNSFQVVNQAVHPVQRRVSTRTLDSFALTDVSFIKIDVEGHEEAVIQGAYDTVRRNKPVLLIESEDQHNSGAPRRVSGMLAELGYQGYFIRNCGLCALDELQPHETDPRNYRNNIRYVNNFIFVQADDQDKISQLRVAAKSLI